MKTSCRDAEVSRCLALIYGHVLIQGGYCQELHITGSSKAGLSVRKTEATKSRSYFKVITVIGEVGGAMVR